jgi:5-methylcytosine-specific restriction protein A
MPRINKRKPCCIPYCREWATKGNYCDKHSKKFHRKDTRPPIYKRPGYGEEWRQVRKAHLEKYPWCEDCLKDGRKVKATDVHHEDGVEQGHKNLTSLCASCHNRRRK